MQLHDVHQGIHRRKKRKRIGRGIGSGHGKTSCKGHKGHASRQGFKLSPIFEGGQMPLARRVPKRGFVNGAFKKIYAIVNLDDLEARFEAGAVVDEAALRAKGLVKGHEFDGIKILGDGALDQALEVHATKFSGSAAEKIAAAGRQDGRRPVQAARRPHRAGGRAGRAAAMPESGPARRDERTSRRSSSGRTASLCPSSTCQPGDSIERRGRPSWHWIVLRMCLAEELRVAE